MITILTSCWAATKKLLNGVNLPVVLSSISRSIRGLTTPVTFPVAGKAMSRSIRGLTTPETFPVDTITTGSKSIRGTSAANNFPTVLATPRANTVLYLKMDGTDGSSVFTDSSSVPKIFTITNVVHSSLKSKFGTTSARFTGLSTNLFRENSNHADLKLHNSDFSVEVYVNFDTGGTGDAQVLIGKAAISQQSWFLYVNSNLSSINFLYNTAGWSSASVTISRPYTFSPDTWYLVEVRRIGLLLYIYVNDVLLGAAASVPSTWYDTVQPLTVGHIGVDGWEYPLKGHVDRVRITKTALTV